jgi:hypothetical protein
MIDRARRFTRPLREIVRRVDDWTRYAYNPQPPLRRP